MISGLTDLVKVSDFESESARAAQVEPYPQGWLVICGSELGPRQVSSATSESSSTPEKYLTFATSQQTSSFRLVELSFLPEADRLSSHRHHPSRGRSSDPGSRACTAVFRELAVVNASGHSPRTGAEALHPSASLYRHLLLKTYIRCGSTCPPSLPPCPSAP